MLYHSTLDLESKISFSQALLEGLPKGGGLYVPETIPDITALVHPEMDFTEIAFVVARQFIPQSEIPDNKLCQICEEAFHFPVPIKSLEKGIGVLELFHGPTLAFKDFAARFMARCGSHFLQASDQKRTVLVATSGDTGGAVADAFYQQPNLNVIILYPSGGVAPLQEQQLTTLGGNIKALEVQGTFDDCQRLVKEALSDQSLKSQYGLMSANSINVARLIPQSFYYVYASLQLQKQYGKSVNFVVPSGNLGNITAAYLAKAMGAPISKLIAAHNRNKAFPEFLYSGEFHPIAPSHATISNAMDVGHPNNFQRLQYFFRDDLDDMRKIFSGYSVDEQQTKKAMEEMVVQYDYYPCPHTAVGYEALQQARRAAPEEIFVLVATAHVAKFKPLVDEIYETEIPLPSVLEILTRKSKTAHAMKPSLDFLIPFLS